MKSLKSYFSQMGGKLKNCPKVALNKSQTKKVVIFVNLETTTVGIVKIFGNRSKNRENNKKLDKKNKK